MRKTFIIIIFLLLGLFSISQVKHGVQDKLAKYFENEQWEDLSFKAERMVVQNKYANDPEILLYLGYSYGKIFLICLEKPELLNKYPEYLDSYQKALNYSLQSIKKDKKTKQFYPDNNDLLEEIIVTGFYYIDNFVTEKKKYPKANTFLAKMMKIYSDENVRFMKAVLCEMSEDTVSAREIFNSVFNELDSIKTKTHKKTDFFMIEACDYYVNYQINKVNPNPKKAMEMINILLGYYPESTLLLYLEEYLENPNIEKTKPENILKTRVLKNLKLTVTED